MNIFFKEQDVNDVIKMVRELYNGNQIIAKNPSKFNLKISDKFTIEDANDILNKKLIKMVSEYANVPYNDGKLSWGIFSHPTFNHGLFNLIGVVIDAILPKILTTQFDMFTNVKNAAWGDKMVIEVTSPDYFAVSKITNGTSNLRRQRLDRRAAELRPEMRGVSIAESLFRILSGKADWGQFMNKVAMSMATSIKTDVYGAIYDSYTLLDATYQASGAFDGTTFVTMAEHVKSACGGLAPTVFGTVLALSKILPATGVAGMTSMNMLDAFNTQGYLGNYRGYNMFAIEQAHIPSTDTFAIGNDFAIIIPMGTNKIANLGFEGEGIVRMETPNDNVGMEMEYSYQRAWDVQILAAMKYSIYRIV